MCINGVIATSSAKSGVNGFYALLPSSFITRLQKAASNARITLPLIDPTLTGDECWWAIKHSKESSKYFDEIKNYMEAGKEGNKGALVDLFISIALVKADSTFSTAWELEIIAHWGLFNKIITIRPPVII